MTRLQVQDSDDVKSRSEWTVFKEIIGTFIGVSPFVIALVIWGASVGERLRVIETRLDHMETVDRRHESEGMEQRREILVRLDRMSNQIEVMQQLLASHSGGIVIRPQNDDSPIKHRSLGGVR